MTLSKRRQVRRTFTGAFASQTAAGAANVMVDSTFVSELAGSADPEIHEVTVYGIATSTVKNAIHSLVMQVGRTSTHAAQTDAGVRTRTVPANPDGIPFVVKFKALRVNPGDQLGVFSFAEVEEDASTVHRMAILIKDVWTELE